MLPGFAGANGRTYSGLSAAMAALAGGNARVGLEDNFYLPDGEMARSNGDLIAKAREASALEYERSMDQLKRELGHLVVDLGEEALKRAQGDYTFFASENLYGLTVLVPPSK